MRFVSTLVRTIQQLTLALSQVLFRAYFDSTQWDSWEDKSHKDDGIVSLIQDLMINPTSHVGYELHKGLVLPTGSFSLPTIFKDMHESSTGGHSGYFCTFKHIVGVIYWKGMKRDIT